MVEGMPDQPVAFAAGEFYAAALVAFDDPASADALEVLRLAHTPELGRTCRAPRSPPLRFAPRWPPAPGREARQRRSERHCAPTSSRLPAWSQRPWALWVAASVAVIATMSYQIPEISRDLEAGFELHPHAQVVRSRQDWGPFSAPGCSCEFGDEPDRCLTAKSRKSFAGTSPTTRASGTKRALVARHVRNRRLADAI